MNENNEDSKVGKESITGREITKIKAGLTRLGEALEKLSITLSPYCTSKTPTPDEAVSKKEEPRGEFIQILREIYQSITLEREKIEGISTRTDL